MLSTLRALAVAAALTVAASAPAAALDLTDRSLDVQAKLDVKVAASLADRLLKLDAASDLPIYLLITSTEGSAQGVLLLADTIRSLKSPVVGVVLTQVHDAGAALAALTDRLYVFPSAGLIFTELDYEGVKKPEPPTPADPKPDADGKPAETPAKAAKVPTPTELTLQRARATFLDRLNARLAKRLQMQPAALATAIANGGVSFDATEAVSKGVAHAVVDQVTYTQLPVDKLEIKVITLQKDTRMLSAPAPGTN